jgi:hypothetical protein
VWLSRSQPAAEFSDPSISSPVFNYPRSVADSFHVRPLLPTSRLMVDSARICISLEHFLSVFPAHSTGLEDVIPRQLQLELLINAVLYDN